MFHFDTLVVKNILSYWFYATSGVFYTIHGGVYEKKNYAHTRRACVYGVKSSSLHWNEILGLFEKPITIITTPYRANGGRALDTRARPQWFPNKCVFVPNAINVVVYLTYIGAL